MGKKGRRVEKDRYVADFLYFQVSPWTAYIVMTQLPVEFGGRGLIRLGGEETFDVANANPFALVVPRLSVRDNSPLLQRYRSFQTQEQALQ